MCEIILTLKKTGVLYKNNYNMSIIGNLRKLIDEIWAFIKCRRLFPGEEKA